MRVLHVLEATLGGTLRYLENIAEVSQSDGLVSGFAYGVSRADSRLVPFLKNVRDKGWSTYEVDMRREINPPNDFRALLHLRRAISDFAPDIVHAHSSKAGALSRLAVRTMRARPAIIYSPHALAASLGQKYLRIEQVFARFTDRFVAVSESEREEIIGFSLARPDQVSVVSPMVDGSHFKPQDKKEARTRLGLADNPLVLCIGRVTAQKNPSGFIEIVRQLHARRTDVRATWVGCGAGEHDLLQMVAAAGMENVIQTVAWQHDVRDYIAAADLLLSPSLFESFGYVSAEALAMGRPVVASDVTGTRDIMAGDLRRWLYPLGDADRAVELILELLESQEAADAAARVGRSEVLQRFGKDRMKADLLATYRDGLRSVRKMSLPT